jgi:hypothetical protein
VHDLGDPSWPNLSRSYSPQRRLLNVVTPATAPSQTKLILRRSSQLPASGLRLRTTKLREISLGDLARCWVNADMSAFPYVIRVASEILESYPGLRKDSAFVAEGPTRIVKYDHRPIHRD